MLNKNKKKKNILIVANCCWYIYNFRLDLINILKQSNQIILLASRDLYTDLLYKNIDIYEEWNLKRGSINPLRELRSISQVIEITNKYQPDIIHNFTIKSCLYGSIAGAITKKNHIINHFTGIGPSFYGYTKSIRIINTLLIPIYKILFNKITTKNIFHNISDKEKFMLLNLSNRYNSYLIEGSGVDTNKFKPIKIKTKFNSPIKILFPARIIKEKGIKELLKACSFLWKEKYSFLLEIAGSIDEENISSLSREEMEILLQNKNIRLLGKSNKILEIYEDCDFVILPSYREGLSMSLLEAGSMGLPIITTDVPGCREIIDHNINGILIKSKCEDELKKAIIFYLDNPSIAIEYGKRLRAKVIKRFNKRTINKKIIEIYNSF